MRKQLISFSQVIKFLLHITLKGGFNPKTPRCVRRLSLAAVATQAPVTTASSNTPVSGSEVSLGGDTVHSRLIIFRPHMLQQLSRVSWRQFLLQIRSPSGDAALQTNSRNVSRAQSSAFSLSNLLLPAPDVQVTAERLQAVRVGQWVSQPESDSQTTHNNILTS